MNHTALKTKIAPYATKVSTCADCHKFKPTGEGRGRGECLLFNTMVFSHYPKVNDCRLNLESEARAKAKDKSLDYLGQEIRDTRLRLEKSKHRLSIKNQLILKAPF